MTSTFFIFHSLTVSSPHMMAQSPQLNELVSIPCLLPCHTDDDQSSALVVACLSDNTRSFHVNRCIDNDAVCEAWALLLHSYLRQEEISFGWHESSDTHYHAHAKLEYLRFNIHRNNDGLGNEVRINLRYRLAVDLEHLRGAVVNSAVSLGGAMTDDYSPFHFVLQVDQGQSGTVFTLYRRPSQVPEIFATAVLHTFLHVLENNNHTAKEVTYLAPNLSVFDLQRISCSIPRQASLRIDYCLTDVFERSSQAHPSAEAICAWDGTCSYRQLNEMTNNLASDLAVLGIKPGDFVAFCFEKSMWASVAILAILKTGAAFMPLCPEQPLERLNNMVLQSNTKVILSSSKAAKRLSGVSARIYVVNNEVIARLPSERRPDVSVAPSDTAFLLFTSGSTGEPKGIVVQHSAACSQMIALGEALGYRSRRTLQFSAHTWDVFVIDTFTTWAFGGCLCVPSEQDRLSNLGEAIEGFGANLAMLTPSVAKLLQPVEVPTLSHLIIGGEALTQQTVDVWNDHSEEILLTQMYGPAETGICIVGHDAFKRGNVTTLGRSLKNMVCILVDPENPNRLVPLGAVGELVVGGPVAKEYLNNPQKTQTSFFEHPTWAEELAIGLERFYRTGDLLRSTLNTLDGAFDFVGRRDTQIKHHGQRIELGEIEQCIARIPNISSSMVTVPLQGPYTDQLVAIVEEKRPRKDKADSPQEQRMTPVIISRMSSRVIRSELAKTLPRYMVPSFIHIVRDMPMTTSMKVDRRKILEALCQESCINIFTQHDTQAMCHDFAKLGELETIARRVTLLYSMAAHPNNEDMRRRLENKDFTLQGGGIGSIGTITFSKAIKKLYNRDMLSDILQNPDLTVRDIAKAIVDGHGGSFSSSTQELTPGRDLMLARDMLRPYLDFLHLSEEPILDTESTFNIFLTGATGFLGNELVRQLLATENIHVICLIRELTEARALQRLDDAAKSNGWSIEPYHSRLTLWLGDLSKKNLGLLQHQIDRLTGASSNRKENHVHAIIHNGAQVHYTLPYHAVEVANVRSTAQLLKWIQNRDTLHSFVYVSGGHKDPLDRDSFMYDLSAFKKQSGYEKSKLASEILVHTCCQTLQYSKSVLRTVQPGFIIGDRHIGSCRPTDYFWRLLLSCIQLGAYNAEEDDGFVFVASRREVASSIVYSTLGRNPLTTSKTLSGIFMRSIWSSLKEMGYKLVAQPKRQWLQQLTNVVEENGESHVMFPFTGLIVSGDLEISCSRPMMPESDDSLKAFNASAIYLQNIGFFPAVRN